MIDREYYSSRLIDSDKKSGAVEPNWEATVRDWCHIGIYTGRGLPWYRAAILDAQIDNHEMIQIRLYALKRIQV